MQPVRLGNNELLIRIASGGAANVFLVRDLSSPKQDRLLALKILLPSLASNEDFVNMFFTEARIASRLSHENVVAITGFGQVEGIHCLAMEYVFGASLAQVLRASARAKKPLTVGVLLRITAAVCDALHFAHEMQDEQGNSMGLVHRDVTPQNILIGFNGVPKLTDFGIAKATNRGWETQAGIVKGKFSYMSPEQALGKKVDRRSDIFGTGIVLWEALTGRDLFKGSTPMEVLTAIREQRIEPPSKVVPGLTPIVDPIVMKALRRSPRQRYATSAEMRDDILDLIRRAGVEIDATTISKEFFAIYGDEIGARAFELRKAMAGKADVEALARVLGGQALSPKHLPVIPGGVTDPDPLGLFSDDAAGHAPPASLTTSAPARSQGTRTDFEIVEEVSELAPRPRSLTSSEESASTEWNEAPHVEDEKEDELLSMLSEEDATVGLLPKEFADRFGAQLVEAREAEARRGVFEEDEHTVGASSGAGVSQIRPLSDEPSRGWDDDPPTFYDEAPLAGTPVDLRTGRPLRAVSGERGSVETGSRPVPRAPSLDISEEAIELTRPFHRAPSLELDELEGSGSEEASGPYTDPGRALPVPSSSEAPINGASVPASATPTDAALDRPTGVVGVAESAPRLPEPPGGVRLSWPVLILLVSGFVCAGFAAGWLSASVLLP